MASVLAESPSVRMSVHADELRPPASLASSSLGMPACVRAELACACVGLHGCGCAHACVERQWFAMAGWMAVCVVSRPCPRSTHAPVMRDFLAPSDFLSSRLFLKVANYARGGAAAVVAQNSTCCCLPLKTPQHSTPAARSVTDATAASRAGSLAHHNLPPAGCCPPRRSWQPCR